MHATVKEQITETQIRIRRHRARHAVRTAGLPLYRALVDRADTLMDQCASLGDVAYALRVTTPRLPR
jgi:hypothetical protein